MAVVVIPFQEQFREAMLAGRKTCTSRTKLYGRAGDTFEAFEATFKLTETHQCPLDFVTVMLFQHEGLRSPEEFKTVWCRLHPRKGWIPDLLVWVHHFTYTGPLPCLSLP